MRRPRRGLVTTLLMILASSPAAAAGGAHVIDDSEVETPGQCHLESWLTLTAHGGLANASPACTPRALPRLELGGFVTHDWSRGSAATLIGIAPKLNLRSESTGLGLGLAGSLGFGLDRRRIESASLIMPVTIPAGDALRVNLNAGWQWTRGPHGNRAFAGAQAEITLGGRLTAMTEAFVRSGEKPGAQAGLRWSGGKKIDIDLLAGRRLNGRSGTAITLGLTVRG